MAQTGFTPISLYYTTTAAAVPTAGNLVAGELAINTADGKLFYKDSGGVVQTLATKTAATFPNVNGATSGAVTLAAPAVAGSNTATFPAATGTVMVSGNMPAFSAYRSGTQSISNSTYTKVQLNAEEFDTANAFDSTTNYRFTPQVAGYYQINGEINAGGSSPVASASAIAIYKNGSPYKYGVYTIAAGANVSVSSLVYLNGSTDYVELYGYLVSVGAGFQGNSTDTYFNGCLVRAA